MLAPQSRTAMADDPGGFDELGPNVFRNLVERRRFELDFGFEQIKASPGSAP
jgi:hypothetical protein